MKISPFYKALLAAWSLALAASMAWAEPWSFGVIADTQWPSRGDDGRNPNSVAADIIRQVNAEFIARRVRLVIAVGDTVDRADKTSVGTRALYAQDLYNAGIAFYPLRGNHDAGWGESGAEFIRVYPQILNGIQNNTPADVDAARLIPAADLAANPPAPRQGKPFQHGTAFSAPESNAVCGGASYSFDEPEARFILLDQFDNSGKPDRTTIPAQMGWIESRLADPKRPAQAFVFGHKGILGSAHKDNLFGFHRKGDPGDADPASHDLLNRFIGALAKGRVHYYISGHDHHHAESVITSPDGASSLHQIISASDSAKFYGPGAPFSANDAPVGLSLNHIGYSIYTVDGPRVTAEYYGFDISPFKADSHGIGTTPALAGNWRKLWTTGYSLNGKEVRVPQGCSYAVVRDTHEGTEMRLLSGTNGSTSTSCGRPLVKAVNTGWAPGKARFMGAERSVDVVTLWGMTEIGGGEKTDTYVIAMSFPASYGAAGPFLATRNAKGEWVAAVEANLGGSRKQSCGFGAWSPKNVLGDYGIDNTDPAKPTAWAVVNHEGDFAVICGSNR